MSSISEDGIRKRAYQIWEREGRPQGRDYEHWVQAQVELEAEVTTGNGGARVAASRAPAGRRDKPSPPSKSVASTRNARTKR